MPKKDRYSKEKKEKTVQAAKGCRSMTDIFEKVSSFSFHYNHFDHTSCLWDVFS